MSDDELLGIEAQIWVVEGLLERRAIVFIHPETTEEEVNQPLYSGKARKKLEGELKELKEKQIEYWKKQEELK